MRLSIALLMFSALQAADWKADMTFHASFNSSLDASVAKGDPKLYSAPDYKRRSEARPGLFDVPVEHAKTAGRNGSGALRFTKKNTAAVFFNAAGNVPMNDKEARGTISFWLQLDPDADLEPGYCDPIQLTAKAYNDSAIWVDFTRDDKPRQFRLGVFGELKSWNPSNVPSDKNPDFLRRLVVVKQAPFSRKMWTHVAITYDKLGTPGGTATLYLNGQAQGTAQPIKEPFAWSAAGATLRLGVNYVGLLDDVSAFRRPLTAAEIAEIAKGVQ